MIDNATELLNEKISNQFIELILGKIYKENSETVQFSMDYDLSEEVNIQMLRDKINYVLDNNPTYVFSKLIFRGTTINIVNFGPVLHFDLVFHKRIGRIND